MPKLISFFFAAGPNNFPNHRKALHYKITQPFESYTLVTTAHITLPMKIMYFG